MVFGTNALVTKPAVSLAPMITVYIMNLHGYQTIQVHGAGTTVNPLDTTDLHNTMFNTVCLTGFVIGLLQIVIWASYTIRKSHITQTNYVET